MFPSFLAKSFGSNGAPIAESNPNAQISAHNCIPKQANKLKFLWEIFDFSMENYMRLVMLSSYNAQSNGLLQHLFP